MLGRSLSVLGAALGSGKLSILIYHQVLAVQDPMRPSEPTVDTFNWQMQLLARHFTPLPLDEAVVRLREGELPNNAVCVTFDDGYRNNLTLAQPILARYAIPATVFVATGFIGGSNMWNDRVIHLFADPGRNSLILDGQTVALQDWAQRSRLSLEWLQRLKYLPVMERRAAVDAMYVANGVEEQEPLMMNQSEIRALHSAGLAIGAHTVNHPILKELSGSDQRVEIVRSRQVLEGIVQAPVTQFAYPNGKRGTDFDDTAVDIVKSEGFCAALSTDWGVSSAQTCPWQLRRFTPWDQSPMRFQARLHMNQLGRV